MARPRRTAHLLRGSREGWARAFLPRLMNRSFFGLLRASLLRPSTPFFGTCFVWQQRGSRRQVASTRSTACARPAGAVTASHWRCDCDRSLCAPESRLWAVWCEERPTGKCRSTCRSHLPLFSDKQWHCSPCESPAKYGRQKPSTRLVMTLPKRFFDDDTSEARSTSTLSAAGDWQPMASSAKISADPLDRRVASVQGFHRPGHLLQLALVGLYWQ